MANDTPILREEFTYDFENVWVGTDKNGQFVAELRPGATDFKVTEQPESEKLQWASRTDPNKCTSAFDRHDERQAVYQSVDNLFGGDPVEKSTVVEQATAKFGLDADRVEHVLEKLAKSGKVICHGDTVEPGDNILGI